MYDSYKVLQCKEHDNINKRHQEKRVSTLTSLKVALKFIYHRATLEITKDDQTNHLNSKLFRYFPLLLPTKKNRDLLVT